MLLVALVVGAATVIGAQQRGAVPGEKGGLGALSGPYEVVPDWPQYPEGLHMRRVSTVWAQTPDRVFAAQEGEIPVESAPETGRMRNAAPRNTMQVDEGFRHQNQIVVFDGSGKVVETWSQWDSELEYIHRLAMNPYDPEHAVWIVDNRGSRVLKFANDGKQMLMALGEFKVEKDDDTHFAGPNDIAFLPNGDFFIPDGSRNRRILKFSKDGDLLLKWGRRCECLNTPGQFAGSIMSVAVDAQERVYVLSWGPGGTMGNLQIFDANGNFLDLWPNIPNGHSISITTDQKYVWVTDEATNKLLQFNMDGHLLYSWGTFRSDPGRFFGIHHLSVDTEGTLYTAEIYGGRIQKFRPRPGADPDYLVGSLFKERVK